ncbi:hypothetical protein ISN45_Aa02g008270 [Arabidopsis thaliana x Arabidopsis arenosa]|uniref:Uncharacterized protein n=1 Tax=Arabidopsis thaliana x Arabidopsis arenosa TaxID=1240361 RepID=A0A8T2BHS3_9BRAS|nr:hypothetical protein ISN45_Aa02g008270 [Arabidopsis thaliana x Arabidopsis arenosa]
MLLFSLLLLKHQEGWKHKGCARGLVVQRGESAETVMRARIGAFYWREHDMVLATLSSHITDVFVTSHVNYQKLSRSYRACVLHIISLCHSMGDFMTCMLVFQCLVLLKYKLFLSVKKPFVSMYKLE